MHSSITPGRRLPKLCTFAAPNPTVQAMRVLKQCSLLFGSRVWDPCTYVGHAWWILSASVLLTSSAEVPESRMTCLAELGNCSPAPAVPPATCSPARPTTQYLCRVRVQGPAIIWQCQI